MLPKAIKTQGEEHSKKCIVHFSFLEGSREKDATKERNG
jgi:hypothetical protein